jgi:GNAT superfamily N-acetyltransferase
VKPEHEGVIRYRPMTMADIDRVPIGCQGGREALAARIRDLGAAAILGYDGDRHVAQLQFRRYDPALRSPDGLWDPLYWGDFGEHAPALPAGSIAVFCYHVGQTDDSEARDDRYQGRGIGLALLDHLIEWAVRRGYAAMVAKCTPPVRSVMSFMGGQPAAAYIERGFELRASWVDAQLRAVIAEKNLVPEATDMDIAARVGCCVRTFG